MLNAIVPVWATETAEHTSRGQFVAIEFTLNIFGVVFAYWIEYACSFYGDGTSAFIWRFPIAFQIVPLLGLFAIVWFFPESPRWLTKVRREAEARYILRRLRGEEGEDRGNAETEFQDIRSIVELERKTSQSQNYLYMLFGIGSGKLHIGRRVQLVIWLQIMQEWIGIAGVTIYQPTVFRIAGISNADSGWVSGLNNTIYMVSILTSALNFFLLPTYTHHSKPILIKPQLSTLVCVFTLDRIGRRWTLYWGSVVMGFSMFLAGAFSRLGIEHTGDAAKLYGGAAVFFVYLFTATFGATWLTVPWLYPAEIFPLEVRARGNAWGVVGWSIGNGWLTLLCPGEWCLSTVYFAMLGLVCRLKDWADGRNAVMFDALDEKTLYIFGACNVLAIPMVYCLYPETNQRTLEEINLVFASDSIWTWEAERNFKILRERNAELVQAAEEARMLDDHHNNSSGGIGDKEEKAADVEMK